MTVDDGSTDSTVLLESWSDVEDHATSRDDVWMDDAGGAKPTVGRMQVVEGAVDETANLRGSAGEGVLPTDGRVNQLERDWNTPCLLRARGCAHLDGVLPRSTW